MGFLRIVGKSLHFDTNLKELSYEMKRKILILFLQMNLKIFYHIDGKVPFAIFSSGKVVKWYFQNREAFLS